MHMSDALVSPAVGGVLWAAAGGLAAWSARRVERAQDPSRVSLMGVLGAFVFAAQMVNFSIPGTGSSGHLGGGVLLAALLGPPAAFLVMASVLLVQALFFADGGLLAFGANALNLGLCTAFLAYPLVYRPIAGRAPSRRRLVAASLSAAVVGLQLGALGVVLETTASGISTLPLRAFLALMLPIHLAIGIGEGLITAAVLVAIRRARPELLGAEPSRATARRLRPVVVGLGVAAALTGGALSWFASTHPDGLEWSLAQVASAEPAPPRGGVHELLARVQQATALLGGRGARGEAAPPAAARAGTAAGGLLGGALVLAVAGLGGVALRAAARRARPSR
jgi:cobalt/nickel transport system permease protein